MLGFLSPQEPKELPLWREPVPLFTRALEHSGHKAVPVILCIVSVLDLNLGPLSSYEEGTCQNPVCTMPGISILPDMWLSTQQMWME